MNEPGRGRKKFRIAGGWRALLVLATLGLSLGLFISSGRSPTGSTTALDHKGPMPTEARVPEVRLDGGPHELIPGSGLFFLGQDPGSRTAIYARRTSDGLILIDTGFSAQRVEDWLRAVNLKIEDVKILLVTHLHADHWFAARDILRRSHASLMIHKEDADALETPHPLSLYFSYHAPFVKSVPVIKVARRLKDGDQVRLGSTRIEVFSTPGHTPGSACFSTVVKGKRVLWTGDTIMTLDSDAYRGNYMTRLGPRYGGNGRAYLHSLERLKKIAVDIVLPGHPSYGKELNARLGPDRWRELVSGLQAPLREWLTLCPRTGKVFLDGKPREITDHVFYLGNSNGTAGYLLKTREGAVCFDPGKRKVGELTGLMQHFGVAPGDLKAVFLTVSVPSHGASAMELCATTGSELYVGRLLANQWNKELPRGYRLLKDGLTYRLGDTTLTVLADPQSWQMAYCVLARLPEGTALLGGDSVSRFGWKPGARIHFARDTSSAVVRAGGLLLFKKLAKEPVSLLLPAHPRYEESPFCTQADWEGLLEPVIQSREKTLREFE